MIRSINIKNIKFVFNITKQKEESLALWKDNSTIKSELKFQALEKEREARITNFHWLN